MLEDRLTVHLYIQHLLSTIIPSTAKFFLKVQLLLPLRNIDSSGRDKILHSYNRDAECFDKLKKMMKSYFYHRVSQE